MELAGYVLQEIAGQDGDGGAGVVAISRLVARRRNVEPDDGEVHGALALLEARGLVARTADRYILSAVMRLRAPKASDGTIGMSRQAWIRLCGSLDLAG